jgi:hypothetical protein
MDDAQSRRVAADLWQSLDFGLGKSSGLRFDLEAYRAAVKMTSLTTELPESRRDYKGRALDFLAPSAWHAFCTLMFFFVGMRMKKSNFDDPDEIDRIYGTQMLYRGQARGWNIVPSAWRFPTQIQDNEKRLDLLEAYWKKWTTPDHDLSFDLFGRIDDRNAAAAIAQHYGLPTPFVDFTFDPRIALWFACSKSNSEPVASLPPALQNCAVVYFTSFLKLINVGKYQIRMPHPAAARIYRQSGCFLDYGGLPESVPEVLDFQQSWMWPQENCSRIFFPRNYPLDDSLQKISHDWIYAPDAFLEESVRSVREIDSKGIAAQDSALQLLEAAVKNRPSWRIKDQLDMSFVYTDEEFFELVRPVESYLRVASLVETKVGPKLDPYVLMSIATTNFDAPRALQSVARFQYSHSPGVLWMSERITESQSLINRYFEQHNKASEPE